MAPHYTSSPTARVCYGQGSQKTAASVRSTASRPTTQESKEARLTAARAAAAAVAADRKRRGIPPEGKR